MWKRLMVGWYHCASSNVYQECDDHADYGYLIMCGPHCPHCVGDYQEDGGGDMEHYYGAGQFCILTGLSPFHYY